MLVQYFLEKSATKYPDKIALICDEERLTYRYINKLSDHFAATLVEMGISRQDRVIIFMDNSVASVVSLFGVLKAGAIFIILNSTMKFKKLNYIINDSGARLIISNFNKLSVIDAAVGDASELQHIILVGKKRQIPSKTSNQLEIYLWSDIFQSAHPLKHSPRANCIDLDIATIIYTSGSTGDPKGVVAAHYNVVSAAQSIVRYLENKEDDIILSALPLSFDYGLYQILMSFLFGGTVILEKSFIYPYKTIEKIIQEKATGFPIVPTMVAILLEMENLSACDLGSLRYITNTAAALPVSYIRKLQLLWPHVKIYSMYGLTECKRVSYLPPEYLDEKPESVGIAIPNEEIFIFDENGQEVLPGQVGELIVRGSNVMQGYWNLPEETDRFYRQGRNKRDVLLHTGDLFKRDEDGFLYFVARKDDMIKTKGERVSPKEIENVLHEMDGVVEAAVIGVSDDILGQAIKAFIVLNDKSNLTDKDVLKYCMRNLEPFMNPKYIEFKNVLQKTNNGKIDKKVLE